MRFGLNVPNFGLAIGPEAIGSWAHRAEQAGFDLLMVSDHVAQPPEVQAGFPGSFYDVFTVLAWLSARTERASLGTTVLVVPYRHPLLTARMAATVDQLAGGRLVLGVAAGWSAQEFAALGVPYRERGAITDEYLAVMTRLWTEPTVAHHGRHVRFDAVTSTPRPTRPLPLWVGGHSPGALRRAARFGDAWHPTSASIGWMSDDGLPALRRAADAAGRPCPRFAPRIKLCITAAPVAGRGRPAGLGTLEQIHGDLVALEKLGADHVVFDTTAVGRPRAREQDEIDREQIELLTTHLIDPRTGTLC